MRLWRCLLMLALAMPVIPAVTLPGRAVAPQQARSCLLSSFNSTTPRDFNVFSQAGEDGILETIFTCAGTTNKRYVEFGVESGVECSTRYLRENHSFTGLMMDGSNYRPEVNLQKEFIYSRNIVQLFEKYNVPHPSFDQLTVDVDLNNFWVVLAVLRGGYRPRSLTVEYNRNLAWHDEYSTVEFPDGWWQGDCYFGATAGAYMNMMTSFGYHLVAVDRKGVNLFFIHKAVVGDQPMFTLADAKRLFHGDKEHDALHGDCYYHPWVKIGKGVDYTQPDVVSNLPIALLTYKWEGQTRQFHEVHEVYPKQLHQRIPRHAVYPAAMSSKLNQHPDHVKTVPAAIWFMAVMVGGAVVGTLMHAAPIRHIASLG